MTSSTRGVLLIGAVTIAVLSVAALCEAQGSSLGEVQLRGADSLAELVVRKSKAWIPPLQSAAKGLFAGLALIQLGWIGVRSILLGHGKVEDALGSMVWEVVQLAFFALLIDKGPEWGLQIIDSLQEVGRRAAETATKPQDLLNHANDLCQKVLEEMSVFDGPVYAVCMGIGLLLMFLSMVCIATFTLVGWAQAFIVLGAGTIVLGLGGSVWTRPIAAGYLRNALAAGLKLLTLELIASIVYGEVEVWIEAAGKGFGVILLLKILGSCLLTLILILSVPSYVASMVTAGGVMSVAESMITRGALALAAWKGMSAGRAARAATGGAPAAAAGAPGAGAAHAIGSPAGARAGAGGPVPSGGGLEYGASRATAYEYGAPAAAPVGVSASGAGEPGRPPFSAGARPVAAAVRTPAGAGSSSASGRPGAAAPSAREQGENASGGSRRDAAPRARPTADVSAERTNAQPADRTPSRAEDAAGEAPERRRSAPVRAQAAAETALRHGPAPKPRQSTGAAASVDRGPVDGAAFDAPQGASLEGAVPGVGSSNGDGSLPRRFSASGAPGDAAGGAAQTSYASSTGAAAGSAGEAARAEQAGPGAGQPSSASSDDGRASADRRAPAPGQAAVKDALPTSSSSATHAPRGPQSGRAAQARVESGAPAASPSSAVPARAPAGVMTRAAPITTRPPAAKPAKEKVRE